MQRRWSLFARMFVGPVFLAVAVAFRGWLLAVLLIVGAIATLFGFLMNQRDLSRAEALRKADSARAAAEGILGTAVEFLHASGIRHVRANFMSLDGTTLSMKYKSTAYGKFEIDNSWQLGDGSCASTAVELHLPVLGGYHGEIVAPEPNVPFRVKIAEMRVLEHEETRSVLSVPVSRPGHDPIGVINFDDDVPLNRSRLTDPAVLSAIKVVADTWVNTVG